METKSLNGVDELHDIFVNKVRNAAASQLQYTRTSARKCTCVNSGGMIRLGILCRKEKRLNRVCRRLRGGGMSKKAESEFQHYVLYVCDCME